MSQVEQHQLAKCPKCKAGRGDPCINQYGEVAEKVHYGRPEWSKKVGYQAPEREAEQLRERGRRVTAGAPPGVWLGASMVLGRAVTTTEPYPCLCWQVNPVNARRISPRDCTARTHV